MAVLLISLLAQDPTEELKQIHRLMREAERALHGVELGRSESSQRDVIERLARLIGSIPPQAGGGSANLEPGSLKPDAGPGRSEPPSWTGGPASRFRSNRDRNGSWDRLPPKEREKMLFQLRAADLFPPEFQSMLQLYWKRIMDGETPQ